MKSFIILTLASILSSPASANVMKMISEEAERRIGAQWVPTALRLAEVESGFRCNAVGPRTRHGEARGVFQVMPGTARSMGFNPRRLNGCRYGVIAGIEHMRRCILHGVKTPRQMAKCHVSGWHGWKRSLNKRGNSYRHKYVKLFNKGR